MSKEAMKLALEALEDVQYYGSDQTKNDYDARTAAITALREALAEQPAPEQGWKLVPVEPTAEMWKAVNKLDDECAAGNYHGKGCSIEQAWNCLLEAAPQPAQRKPMTVKEIAEFVGTHEYGLEQLKWFRLGEATHGIKENT